MKRSEMLNMIKHILETVDPKHVDTPDILLTAIENAEMKPPAYVNVLLGDHMDFYEINEWEDEDEKK